MLIVQEIKLGICVIFQVCNSVSILSCLSDLYRRSHRKLFDETEKGEISHPDINSYHLCSAASFILAVLFFKAQGYICLSVSTCISPCCSLKTGQWPDLRILLLFFIYTVFLLKLSILIRFETMGKCFLSLAFQSKRHIFL